MPAPSESPARAGTREAVRLRAHWREPFVLVAAGLGSGFLPGAPGTWGSLLAVAAWWLVLVNVSIWVQLLAVAVVTLLGAWVVARVQQRHGVGDPGAVVIDEVAGQWLALVALPGELAWMLAALVLFRLFDILKPWPVGVLERRIHGAWGVMADDLGAGVLAFLVLQFTLAGLPYI